MDEDKKTPTGTDDSFDEHELDLDVPDDLKSIPDEEEKEVNFSDTQAESLSIFDEFDDSNDFGEFEASLDKEPEQEVTMGKKSDEPLFDDSLFGDQSFDEDFFKEGSADNFKMDESPEEPYNNQSPLGDEDLFTSDAFEDVTSGDVDFPEGEAGSKLGDSQLFDYEPGSTQVEEGESPEEMYAAPMSGGGGGGKKAGGPGSTKNRRIIRVVVLLVLIAAVYGALRLFTGSSSSEVPEMAAAPSVQAPTPVQAETASIAPNPPTEIPAPSEAPASTPPMASAPTESLAPSAAPELASTPPAVPLSPATPSTTQASAPVAAVPQAQVPAQASNIQAPQTSFSVPAPSTSVSVPAVTPQTAAAPAQAQASMPSDQIASKLSSLEASIMAIDDRLSNLAQTKAKAPENIQSITPFGKAAPETQEVMIETLQDIDKKMSYLAELQSQVHILNKEVSSLKNDVVQQSIIVGQNQAQINQNLVSHLDKVVPKMIVQAAIPGRAWLRSETGQLMTVIPGDEVPGYGRVVSIDPTTGTVVMSSRAVFREQ